MDGWTDGWMDGCVHVCIYIYHHQRQPNTPLSPSQSPPFLPPPTPPHARTGPISSALVCCLRWAPASSPFTSGRGSMPWSSRWYVVFICDVHGVGSYKKKGRKEAREKGSILHIYTQTNGPNEFIPPFQNNNSTFCSPCAPLLPPFPNRRGALMRGAAGMRLDSSKGWGASLCSGAWRATR